jgi:hypothetical protein
VTRFARSRRTPTTRALLAVGVLAGCSWHATPAAQVHGHGVVVESALARKAEADRMVREIAAALSPDSAVRAFTPDIDPTPCTAPLNGQVYYTISREFDAPIGSSGADLAPGVIAQLRARHFEIDEPNTLGDHISVTAGTNVVDLSVLAMKDSRTVRINIDTQCGTPEPGSQDGGG